MHTISVPQSAIERGRLFHPQGPIVSAKTAVIAIDFQRFFIDDDQPMGNLHARDILDNANLIHDAVRRVGGTVVFTQHSAAPVDEVTDPTARIRRQNTKELLPGSPSYDIHPGIRRMESDVTVIKHRSSPLHPHSGAALNEILRERGIETLIITGLVTNGCCESTSRDAFQYGYEVILATDATAAMSDDEHNAALLNLSIYYANVMSAEEIVRALS